MADSAWLMAWWPFDVLTESIANEPLKIRLAFYVGFVSFLTAVFASVWTVVLRVAFDFERRRRKKVRRRWTEILLEAMDGGTPELPRVGRIDRRNVITRFNYLFETLTGDAHVHLRRFAATAGLERDVLRMLSTRNMADRLTAIVSAGHLKTAPAAPILASLMDHSAASVSLAAAQARTRIEPEEAVGPVVAEFARRRTWHLASVVDILKDARPFIGTALADALRAAPAGQRRRIIDLIGALRDPPGIDEVRVLLSEPPDDPSLVASMLRAVAGAHDPRDLTYALRYTHDADPRVRAAAAMGLGALGDESHLALLAEMLTDASASVRYEAERAVLQLPRVTKQRIDETLAALHDPQARAAFLRVAAHLEVA